MFKYCCNISKAGSVRQFLSIQETKYVNKITCIRNLYVQTSNQNITNVLKNDNNILLESRRYAGHSKWQNIKSTKEARDDMRQRMITLLVRKVKVAITAGGGQTNPKLNIHLARILDEAKMNDVPFATMSRAIERTEKSAAKSDNLFCVDARSMSGVAFLIESYAERPKIFKQKVQRVMKTYGGMVLDSGVSTYLFNRKGVIYVPVLPTDEDNNKTLEKLEFDKAFEIAIEAGADDVVCDVDENNDPIYKYICDVQDFNNVKKFLEEQNLKLYEARLEYLPHTHIKVGGEILELTEKLIRGLEELEDTETIYHNAEFVRE